MKILNVRTLRLGRARLSKIFLIVSLVGVASLVSSCSMYSSSFSCGDAKGANCMSMDKVDRMIANGEIEEYTAPKQKNCRGSKCRKQVVSLSDEELRANVPVSSSVTYYENGLQD